MGTLNSPPAFLSWWCLGWVFSFQEPNYSQPLCMSAGVGAHSTSFVGTRRKHHEGWRTKAHEAIGYFYKQIQSIFNYTKSPNSWINVLKNSTMCFSRKSAIFLLSLYKQELMKILTDFPSRLHWLSKRSPPGGQFSVGCCSKASAPVITLVFNCKRMLTSLHFEWSWEVMLL